MKMTVDDESPREDRETLVWTGHSSVVVNKPRPLADKPLGAWDSALRDIEEEHKEMRLVMESRSITEIEKTTLSEIMS